MSNNKFKFKLKITGFEMEIEGSKEDVATISSNISNQLKGLVQPQGIADFEGPSSKTEDAEVTIINDTKSQNILKKKHHKKRDTNNNNASKTPESQAIDFKTDPSKYSSPSTDWSVLNKATWLLYVIQQEQSISEMTPTSIADTFNKHFRQAKTIRPSHVSRELGKQKTSQKPLVQEDTTKNPAPWYLTNDGIKFVQNLILETKNGTN